ncbi:hypothetical protein [Amaricoccus solimangrovi]|uniref:Uncharacterized protein n=1 Tax=Amaricoccus solimangrovi TaxID=2589815 RepID=A0A501WSW7_9RHOB|nr:hypothetical protein [Amaricoccus solimangrovi]TPE52519.1 hypothetical protein FJM51_04890 [Amaricoccus solimangrovi]
MAVTDDPSDPHAALQARINAARRRLADNENMEWAELGTLLEGLSEEIHEMEGHPDEKREEIYARAHKTLDEIHEKLESE